jgi:translation initiation factor 2 subunit 2
MSEEYLRLLNKALEKVPRKSRTGARFEIPAPQVEAAGNKTMLMNFAEIAERLNRDPKHLLKFLSKELATSGAQVGGRAIFQGRFPSNTIQRLVTIYADKYVVCPICKSPDTSIAKEGPFHFLLCEACGAKSSILES